MLQEQQEGQCGWTGVNEARSGRGEARPCKALWAIVRTWAFVLSVLGDMGVEGQAKKNEMMWLRL